MTSQALTAPFLRFPDFNDPWKEIALDKAATFSSSKRVYLSDYVENGIPFYRGKEISELKRNEIPQGILYITEESYYRYKEQYGVPEIGDILITAVGTLGNVYRITGSEPFYFKDGNLIWLRNLMQDPAFVEVLLECKNDDVLKSSIGSSQRALTMVELKKLRFHFPTLPEQRKIADFLTAVDGRIGQLSQKKALLEDYKKGVMQQIFTQALRFKDDHGNDFPEWEVKTLGEAVAEIKSGLSLDQNIDGTGFKVTRIETISDRTINMNKVGYVVTDKNIEDFRLLPGDILFSNINSVSHIGKVAYVDRDYGLYQGMNLLRIRCGNKSDASFLFQMLKSVPFVHYFQRICNQAVSQASINQADLKKSPLKLPSLAEQKRIANFLTALDRKIESVAQQIRHTQAFKKGLLQQMFV